jgi:hypothetical protein
MDQTYSKAPSRLGDEMVSDWSLHVNSVGDLERSIS